MLEVKLFISFASGKVYVMNLIRLHIQLTASPPPRDAFTQPAHPPIDKDPASSPNHYICNLAHLTPLFVDDFLDDDQSPKQYIY